MILRVSAARFRRQELALRQVTCMARRLHESTPADWRRDLLHYIAEHPDRPQKLRGLARALNVHDKNYADFRVLVREMMDAGELVLGPARTITLPERSGTVLGIFRPHPRGFGFIQSPGRPDLFVPRGKSGTAQEGDLVNAKPLRQRAMDEGPAAEITRIVRKAEIRWVGEVDRIGADWIVRCQGKMAGTVVHIGDPTAKSVQPGDLVVVEPLPQAMQSAHLRGVVIERLGDPGELRSQIRGVIRRYGIPEEFDPGVRDAARTAAESLDERTFGDREDLRELLTITIDPPDARDFDDAISIKPLADDEFELGVHIADVAHFVVEDSTLDAEARRRGNSVYLPGYVVPMLPEILSNGVCSLVPGEPRLTKSAFIRYDKHGRARGARFCNSVIQSHARFAYEEVADLLKRPNTIVPAHLMKLLRDAETLARRIRERRLANGMIVLQLPELAIKLNEQRDAVMDAGPAENSFPHTIIEMFMVEANEAVCRVLAGANLNPLRRLHPPPAEEAGEGLERLLRPLGRRAPKILTRESILALLKSVENEPAAPVVHFCLLRCLPRAFYGPAPEGHFALASDDYAHFTSPIRRYPDLVVHRQLDMFLRHKALGPKHSRAREANAPTLAQLQELGRHCSVTERRAADAERDVKQLCLIQLMREKVGQVFEGLITGVTPYGVYVRTQPNLADGVVRLTEFGPDHWDYDSDAASFRGRDTKRVIHFGQLVHVRLIGVDELRQELVFAPKDTAGLGEVSRIRTSVAPQQRRKSGRRGTDRRTPRRGRRR